MYLLYSKAIIFNFYSVGVGFLIVCSHLHN